MSNVAVILGANGALGRALVRAFSRRDWLIIPDTQGALSTKESTRISSRDQISVCDVLEGLGRKIDSSGGKVRAVINVAGGFRMDSASSDDFLVNYEAMNSGSLGTSMVSARIAAKYLVPGGILVLPGAAAALNPTPWAVTYGACKAGVHHLVRSLGAKKSGMPDGSVTVGIAPAMLDTPANRESMPDADPSSWTPLEVVAERIFGWASGTEAAETGSIYSIETRNGQTSFVKV